MQTAAKINRFLTGCSSKAGFPDSVFSRGGLIQHIVASHLAQTIHSQDTFFKLTNTLIQFAEQAYALRDMNALQEINSTLSSLPIDGAWQIGLYYSAVAAKRRGQINEAHKLFENVIDNGPATYRARAIQGLGALHHDIGKLDEALRFQFEALRVGSDKNADDLQTMLMAHLEVSHFRSDTGDHKGALAILENISPLVYVVAKQNPFYFHFYHNELAFELGELGRIAEAEAALRGALNSHYAAAYPNWAETRQELEAKRTFATPSVVAINRPPEAKRSPRIEPQREVKQSKKLSLIHLASIKDSFQRSVFSIPATATNIRTAISILERLLTCIGPRAPPAVFLSRSQ